MGEWAMRETNGWLAVALVGAFAQACSGDQEPPGAGRDAVAEQAPSRDGMVADTTAEGPEAAGDGGSGESAHDARDGRGPLFALFAGSNFGDDTVQLTAIDWSSRERTGSTVISAAFADALPLVSKGRAFLLERSASKLLLLDSAQPWKSTKTVDLAGSDDSGLGTDPLAVVNTGSKAYVPLYYENTIAIVDVEQAKVTGRVELAQFVADSDPDERVDVFDGVFDEATHRAYFLLQRIPQYERGIEPDRVSHCLPVAPLIVAVDTTTDQIVDLHADAGGAGISLLGANPGALVPDLGHGKLFVVEVGCYRAPDGGDADAAADAQASFPREGRGIEVVDLASRTSDWRYRHTGPHRLSGVVLVDATHAFVSMDDASYATHWYPWNPSGPTLGAEVSNFPTFAPKYLGGTQVVGISPRFVDGGTLNALVAFDIGSQQTTTLVSDIFGDPKYDGEYNGWALYP